MKKDHKPLGIQGIASIIPENWVDTTALADTLGVRSEQHGAHLGISRRSKRYPGQEASDLCVAAAEKLLGNGVLDPDAVDFLLVIGQNPDGYGIPHTASIVQRKLGLLERCATFDVGLGGSGYVYGLSIALSFMRANNRRCGLLFTADPCSRMIDESDSVTALRYGDAATVTVLSDEPHCKR